MQARTTMPHDEKTAIPIFDGPVQQDKPRRYVRAYVNGIWAAYSKGDMDTVIHVPTGIMVRILHECPKEHKSIHLVDALAELLPEFHKDAEWGASLTQATSLLHFLNWFHVAYKGGTGPEAVKAFLASRECRLDKGMLDTPPDVMEAFSKALDKIPIRDVMPSPKNPIRDVMPSPKNPIVYEMGQGDKKIQPTPARMKFVDWRQGDGLRVREFTSLEGWLTQLTKDRTEGRVIQKAGYSAMHIHYTVWKGADFQYQIPWAVLHYERQYCTARLWDLLCDAESATVPLLDSGMKVDVLEEELHLLQKRITRF